MEELADYLVTGRVSPVSRESMERFNIETDDSYTNYYEDNNQLILTISYPDPRNPLASSPAVTNVYFLRKNSQAAFLQNYISDHFYKCTDDILRGLGQMYVNDMRFKSSIDDTCGEGTAEFVSNAIAAKK